MFYDNFLRLCNKKGISPTAAVVEMGFQKSVASRWKQSIPTDANKLKIAEYFGVTVEELMASNEEKPAPESRNGLSIKEQKDIARKLEKMMDELEESGDLMFDGNPASEEAKESIRNALAMGLEYARKVNREKYNPYKNKKKKD